MIRLLLCATESAAETLRRTLAPQPEIEVVGAAAGGADAVALAFTSSPDVIALDAGTADAVATAAVVRRAASGRARAWADVGELAELYRLGIPTPQALAAPLVADEQVLGAVLVAMPPTVELELDADLVDGVIELAANAIAAER